MITRLNAEQKGNTTGKKIVGITKVKIIKILLNLTDGKS